MCQQNKATAVQLCWSPKPSTAMNSKQCVKQGSHGNSTAVALAPISSLSSLYFWYYLSCTTWLGGVSLLGWERKDHEFLLSPGHGDGKGHGQKHCDCRANTYPSCSPQEQICDRKHFLLTRVSVAGLTEASSSQGEQNSRVTCLGLFPRIVTDFHDQPD